MTRTGNRALLHLRRHRNDATSRDRCDRPVTAQGSRKGLSALACGNVTNVTEKNDIPLAATPCGTDQGGQGNPLGVAGMHAGQRHKRYNATTLQPRGIRAATQAPCVVTTVTATRILFSL